MTYSIDSARLARLPEVHLRSGKGAGGNGTVDVCAMQLADWLVGGLGRTDAPKCVDPVIQRFVIGLNDAGRFAAYRDELIPYVVRAIGTNTGPEATRTRSYLCADWAVRVIAPLAFEYWAQAVPTRRDEALGWAKKLREVAPIADVASASAGCAMARTAAYAPAAAYAAAAAAYAAAADAAAAAYAAADAAAAAYAAYAAAAAAVRSKGEAFSRAFWDESLTLLSTLIRVCGPTAVPA